ncbi:MAG: hypothetical protein LC793_08615 [Thermomicrobia bacterium]|nr:hypothetical protein [Thermomicrobia bacterium]MCA1723472.1 hypothetical protein [Thermomicrobia bacterium]
MQRRGAGLLIACIAGCLIVTMTACSSKKITVGANDPALVATASGPTPTPLANGLHAAPTTSFAAATQPISRPEPTSPAPAQYAAPAAPTAGIPRKVIEEFYNAVLAKRNIAAFLTPALRATANGDGYALLGAVPPMRFFSVDGQEMSADGMTATVTSTLSVANGTATIRFAMQPAGDTWLIDRVVSA